METISPLKQEKSSRFFKIPRKMTHQKSGSRLDSPGSQADEDDQGDTRWFREAGELLLDEYDGDPRRYGTPSGM